MDHRVEMWEIMSVSEAKGIGEVVVEIVQQGYVRGCVAIGKKDSEGHAYGGLRPQVIGNLNSRNHVVHQYSA